MKGRKTLVHRCRFVEWAPEAVSAMEASPIGSRPMLAVVRGRGDLEILDVGQNWARRQIPCGGAVGHAIQSVLWLHPAGKKASSLEYGSPEDFQVSSLHVMTWGETTAQSTARLFTAGYDGNIIEWDVDRLCPKRVANVGGGSIWCMAKSADESRLAVGCEDGRARIVCAKSLTVLKTLPFHEGKALSICWSDCELNLIAMGTSDSALILWDVEASKTLHKIAIDARHDNPTSVWVVRFAGHFLVSGNSLGQTQFWSPHTGTLVSSWKEHQADVLAIAMRSTCRRVFVSGADGCTKEFAAFGEEECETWRPVSKRYDHSHDIRASTCFFVPSVRPEKGGLPRKVTYHEVVVSAGVDGSIIVYAAEGEGKRKARRLSCIPSKPVCRFAENSRLLASHVGTSIHIWSLGELERSVVESSQGEEACRMVKKRSLVKTHGLSKPGRKIMQINVPNHESIGSFDISPDGRFIAYTTRSAARVYHLIYFKDKDGAVNDVQICKVEMPSVSGQMPQQVAFSPDSQAVAVAYLDEQASRVVAYSLKDPKASAPINFETTLGENASNSAAIDSMVWRSKHIAVHDLLNNVHVLSGGTGKREILKQNLPAFIQLAQLTSEPRQLLVMISVDNQIYHQTIAGSKQSCLVDLPVQWKSQLSPVIGLAVVPEDTPDSGKDFCARIWSHDSIAELMLSEGSDAPQDNLKIHRDYQNILLLQYLGPEEAVVIERPWDDILEQMPKAHDRKRFGGF